eukprot:gene24781-29945_t
MNAHSQSQLGEDEHAVLLETGLADKTHFDAYSASPDSSLASMFIRDLFSDVESSSDEGWANESHSPLDACSASSSSSSADSIFVCRNRLSDDVKSGEEDQG